MPFEYRFPLAHPRVSEDAPSRLWSSPNEAPQPLAPVADSGFAIRCRRKNNQRAIVVECWQCGEADLIQSIRQGIKLDDGQACGTSKNQSRATRRAEVSAGTGLIPPITDVLVGNLDTERGI